MIDTIRGRLVAAFTVFLIGLLWTGLLGIRSLRDLSEEVDLGLAQLRRGVGLGNELQGAVLQVILTGEGYLVHGRAETKRRFTEAAARAQELGDQYRELAGSPGEVEEVERLTGLLTHLEVEFARAHALYDIGRREEAKRQSDAAHPVAEEVAAAIVALSERQAAALAASTSELRQRADERSSYVLGILILAFVVGAALVIVTVRSIDRPLARLVYAAGQLGGGDLRTRVGDGRMPREFTAVGEAFDSMAVRLRDLAAEVIRTAHQLSSSASDFSGISEQIASSTHEVSSAVGEISEGADRQARTLQDTTSAVSELRSGATEIESETVRNRELSQAIRRDAGQSQVEVQRALQLLLALRKVVHDTAQEVGALEDASAAITGFVERISSIAQQTHLLALNAAIEAARAGEEGRGFSVVAEEVRKLAAEADRAAHEVGEVVDAVRHRVEHARGTMQEGEAQVRLVEGVARGADEALGAITSGLERIATAAGQVVSTVERNLRLLDEVARHVLTVTETASAHAARSQDVSATVEEQTAATEEIAASAAELVTAAENLRRVVREWQV